MLFGLIQQIPNWKYGDFLENQLVITGSPATVRDQLEAAVKKLRVGNLMVLLHIGSMPHELTLKNIELFCREVKPKLSHIWDDQWKNHWWPKRLLAKEDGARLEREQGTSATAEIAAK
jgi:hypothetical protein